MRAVFVRGEAVGEAFSGRLHFMQADRVLEEDITLSPSGGKVFLFGQKDLDRKSPHRGGAALLAPASKAALPYVPLPARTGASAVQGFGASF